jgi:hypothetical protein
MEDVVSALAWPTIIALCCLVFLSRSDFRKIGRQHITMWALICGPVAICLFIVIVRIVLFRRAPGPIWKTVAEIGPAITGSWVLAAGLLAITAAGLSIRANEVDKDDRLARRQASVRGACIGEILSFLDRINGMNLKRLLEDHIQKVYRHGSATEQPALIFRRSLDDEWFMLSRSDPVTVAELGVNIGARYLSLSRLARNLVGKFDYLNSLSLEADPSKRFWYQYHKNLLDQYSEVERQILVLLTLLEADPKVINLNFKFESEAENGLTEIRA